MIAYSKIYIIFATAQTISQIKKHKTAVWNSQINI